MSPSADEHPVRLARVGRGWRLKDLADACGRSVSFLSMTEKGMVPKASSRARIARALELPVAVLWPDEDDNPTDEPQETPA